MDIEGKSVDWNEIKDKTMKIALNLKTAVDILKVYGANIEEVNGVYWIEVNSKSKHKA